MGGGLLFDEDCFFDFPCCPVGLSGQDSAIVQGETMPHILAMFTDSRGFVEVPVFLEPFFESLFGFSNVFVGGILFTGEFINYTTLLFIRSWVFGMN